jgi:hypothetical protein
MAKLMASNRASTIKPSRDLERGRPTWRLFVAQTFEGLRPCEPEAVALVCLEALGLPGTEHCRGVVQPDGELARQCFRPCGCDTIRAEGTS